MPLKAELSKYKSQITLSPIPHPNYLNMTMPCHHKSLPFKAKLPKHKSQVTLNPIPLCPNYHNMTYPENTKSYSTHHALKRWRIFTEGKLTSNIQNLSKMGATLICPPVKIEIFLCQRYLFPMARYPLFVMLSMLGNSFSRWQSEIFSF